LNDERPPYSGGEVRSSSMANNRYTLRSNIALKSNNAGNLKTEDKEEDGEKES
jgi:hypothetical protein